MIENEEMIIKLAKTRQEFLLINNFVLWKGFFYKFFKWQFAVIALLLWLFNFDDCV